MSNVSPTMVPLPNFDFDFDDSELAELSPPEIDWRDNYHFLKERGYTLRRRFEPGWKASWLNTSIKRVFCEDSVPLRFSKIMDATRDDGSFVILKMVDTRAPNFELEVAKHVSSAEFTSNPRNRCVPILEIIHMPEGSHTAFIVMPLLFRFDNPSFETIGEVVGFFSQIFEGLQYMHENNIVHGDCKMNNILADTGCLFDSPPHPWASHMKRDYSKSVTYSTSRTRRPVNYYFIDFDLAQIYKSEHASFLRAPPWGGDKSVPEHQDPNGPPCDTFAVDVYCIGNLVRRRFLDGSIDPPIDSPQGFDFMRPLVNDMVNIDPSKRPSMSEVVSRFNVIVAGLSQWKLRSPYLLKDERHGTFKSTMYWIRQLSRMARLTPAVPKI